MGCSTMNVISLSAVQRRHLKVCCQPYPFKVVWVNKANLTVTNSYKVPIQKGNYIDEILCDVLTMHVVHILLG